MKKQIRDLIFCFISALSSSLALSGYLASFFIIIPFMLGLDYGFFLFGFRFNLISFLLASISGFFIAFYSGRPAFLLNFGKLLFGKSEFIFWPGIILALISLLFYFAGYGARFLELGQKTSAFLPFLALIGLNFLVGLAFEALPEAGNRNKENSF